MFFRLPLRFLLFLCALPLAACEPTLATRGQILEPEKIAQIEIGKSTREDVANLLGSPTEIATFDEKVWYYIGRSTEQYSFLDPEVIKQKAVEVRFNDEGTVTAMRTFNPALAEDISPVGRKTPTYGHNTTFFEQLLGNLGRPGGLGGRESKK